MSVDFIKFAFSAGELAPQLLGRPDLEKFDLGLKIAHNWFVDYHGGLATRPGTEFLDYLMEDDNNIVLAPFKFNADIANTYVVIFGHNYIRFMQDGGYVLEPAKTIQSVTSAAHGAITCTGVHGYSTGDWVKVGSRTFQITVLSTTVFSLEDAWGGNVATTGGVATALLAEGSVSRIYTLASVYSSSDLSSIRVSQRLDTLRLTHPTKVVYDLKRVNHTSWTLTPTVFGSSHNGPAGLTGTPKSAGAFGFIWTVTAVFADGSESGFSGIFPETGTVNYSSVAGGYRYSWLGVAGAVAYNVYRSNIVDTVDVNKGLSLGFIGSTTGRLFSEVNIIPDFTRTPPQDQRPFDPGRITQIDMTNAGSGYSLTTTTVAIVGQAGSGTGFVGNPIVFGGTILATSIIKAGKDFIPPVAVSFPAGGGASGAATADVSPLTGCFPTLSAKFQQREVYAATLNDPLTIWASKPGRLNNFDTGAIVTDSDAYSFDLDTEEITPIRHMVSMRSGLLLLTNFGIWQLTGGGLNNAVTPTNALADPHSYTGVSKVQPIKIDTDLLYQESKGAIIRLLSYNDFSKVYSGTDISILSSHFFTRANLVLNWAFAPSPYALVWAPRRDGSMLGFTIVKEQNVYAWTEHKTRGQFTEGLVSLQEDVIDRTYFVIKRMVNGRTVKYIERMTDRQFDHVEDSFQVDSGLKLLGTFPASVCSADAITGTVNFTSTLFAPGDVGKILRMAGGKARIDTYISALQVTGTWLRNPTQFYPESDDTIVMPAEEGGWTLDDPITAVSGLWHLEGEEVSILADGNVLQRQTVVNGAIDLGREATRVVAGLPYKCIAQTLPLTAPDTVIESRRKRVVGVAVRFHDSRGVRIGVTLDKTYPFKERTTEAWGEPTRLMEGIKHVPTMPHWDNDGSVYFLVQDPVPATILGYILDTEVGDDKE